MNIIDRELSNLLTTSTLPLASGDLFPDVNENADADLDCCSMLKDMWIQPAPQFIQPPAPAGYNPISHCSRLHFGVEIALNHVLII